MPNENDTFDTMNINSGDILDSEELNAGPDSVETTEPEPVTEAAEDTTVEITGETTEPEEPEAAAEPDAFELMAQRIADQDRTIAGLLERIAALEAKNAENDAREAARAKRMTGFFAPVTNGTNPDPGENPLPRIERQYVF